MSPVDKIYVAIAIPVLILSVRNWRGVLWLACLMVSFFLSGAWWRAHGFVHGELFTLLCDTAVFLAIYAAGRHWWEFALLCVQLLMVAASLSFATYNFIGGSPSGLEVYQITLEALNALSLFLIGGIGAYTLVGRTHGVAFDNVRHLFGFGFADRGQGD